MDEELLHEFRLLNLVFHASRSSFESADNKCLLWVSSCFSSNINVFGREQISLGATCTSPRLCVKSKVPMGV